MATKTQSDVVTHALRILLVISDSESPDGDIASMAGDEYVALHEDMRVDYGDLYKSSRISWNRDAVPEDYFAHVAGLLAGRLVDVVPVSAKGAQKGAQASMRADRAIRRRLARNNPDYSRYDAALSPAYSNAGRGIWR